MEQHRRQLLVQQRVRAPTHVAALTWRHVSWRAQVRSLRASKQAAPAQTLAPSGSLTNAAFSGSAGAYGMAPAGAADPSALFSAMLTRLPQQAAGQAMQGRHPPAPITLQQVCPAQMCRGGEHWLGSCHARAIVHALFCMEHRRQRVFCGHSLLLIQ